MGFAKVAAHKGQEKPALLEQWPDLGYLGLGAWWGVDLAVLQQH